MIEFQYFPNPNPVRYAGFWRRFNAYSIDATVVAVLTFLPDLLSGSPALAQSTPEIEALQQAGLIPQGDSQALLQALLAQSGGDGSLSGLIASSLSGMAFAAAISAIYNIGFVASHWQATPGKRWLGLKIVMRDGSRPNLLQSAYRHIMSGVSVVVLGGLGYLTMPFSKEKAALHDMICNTRVVRI